jgi:hypothetical protein
VLTKEVNMGKKKNKRKRDGNREQKEKAGSRKFPIVALLIVVIAVGAFGVFAYTNTHEGSPTGKLTMADMAALKGGEDKPTLSPSYFRGKTAVSYSVAGAAREVLDYLYCYCNCKQSIGHKSLLSCFTDNHAANCGICQDQALYAKNLMDEGYELPEIREKVDNKFWRPLR